MISNEQVTHVMAFSTDLTSLWKTNLELKNNEQRLRKLTEQISDAIVLLNENHEIEYASRVTTKITGYDPETLIHHGVSQFIFSEDIPFAEKIIEDSFNQPGVSLSFQLRIQDAQGSVFKVKVKGFIVNQLEDSNVRAYILNFRMD